MPSATQLNTLLRATAPRWLEHAAPTDHRLGPTHRPLALQNEVVALETEFSAPLEDQVVLRNGSMALLEVPAVLLDGCAALLEGSATLLDGCATLLEQCTTLKNHPATPKTPFSVTEPAPGSLSARGSEPPSKPLPPRLLSQRERIEVSNGVGWQEGSCGFEGMVHLEEEFSHDGGGADLESVADLTPLAAAVD